MCEFLTPGCAAQALPRPGCHRSAVRQFCAMSLPTRCQEQRDRRAVLAEIVQIVPCIFLLLDYFPKLIHFSCFMTNGFWLLLFHPFLDILLLYGFCFKQVGKICLASCFVQHLHFPRFPKQAWPLLILLHAADQPSAFSGCYSTRGSELGTTFCFAKKTPSSLFAFDSPSTK